MRVSYSWLNNYVSLDDITPDELAQALTMRSQEVEAVFPLAHGENLVIGEVRSVSPHEKADKLVVCEVDVKKRRLTIICGAPNVREGQKVVCALPGAVLAHGLKIEKTEIRGVVSEGMIVSLSELGIDYKYHHEDGIHVLHHTAPVGEDAMNYLFFNDTVIDLDLTPNRADMLSMIGVAYDVAAIFDKRVEIPKPKIITAKMENSLTIETETEACKSYYGRVLDDVTIGESPRWMRSRLIAAGIRPINNVVDITNYVMLETGQPLHAFDYEKVGEERVLVRDAKKGETFTTLDDEERTLEAGDILITNGKVPIALGGVMGGAETEVTEKTTSILLESATFDPRQIRRTSGRLGLRSESSLRFERGVDPARTRFALDRAAALLAVYASASIRDGVKYFDHHERKKPAIELSLDKLNRVLGSNFDIPHVKGVLERLAFPFTEEDGIFRVDPPSRRQDINTYQDLIEEIGRLSDYNILPETFPTTISRGGLSDYQRFKRRTRHILADLGLCETMTYALRETERVHDLAKDKKTEPISLANPLSRAQKTLVLTSLHGLFDVAAHNRARKVEAIHIYEIGKRYDEEAEKERLGILMCGPYRTHLWQKTAPTNFFTLKGLLESLADALRFGPLTFSATEIENYHPHQCAIIEAQDEEIGHIGKVHPEYADAHGLKDVYLAEIDIGKAFGLGRKRSVYTPLPKHPGMQRDIALLVDDAINAEDIKKTARACAGDILADIRVFDLYEGEKLPEGKKSLAFRLRFEDAKETLQAETVDKLVQDIVKALEKEHGAVQR